MRVWSSWGQHSRGSSICLSLNMTWFTSISLRNQHLEDSYRFGLLTVATAYFGGRQRERNVGLMRCPSLALHQLKFERNEIVLTKWTHFRRVVLQRFCGSFYEVHRRDELFSNERMFMRLISRDWWWQKWKWGTKELFTGCDDPPYGSICEFSRKDMLFAVHASVLLRRSFLASRTYQAFLRDILAAVQNNSLQFS